MTKAKRFVLWLAEKLGVDLEEHFKPGTEDELFQFIETEFELTTEEKAEMFLIRFGEDYLDLDLEEHYRPKSAEHFAEDIEKARKTDEEDEEDISFVDFMEYIALEADAQEDLEDHFDTNPVEQIYELEDEPGKLYLWKLPSEWSDQKRDNLFARLVQSYRDKFNRDPKSAHLLLTELDEVQEVDRDEMKDLLGYAGKDL